MKIFSDSLQAVSDSLFYLSRIPYSDYTRIPLSGCQGESDYGRHPPALYQNSADRLKAFQNSFLVNQIEPGIYNQVKSNRLDGWFTDGNIDSVRSSGMLPVFIIYRMRTVPIPASMSQRRMCWILILKIKNWIKSSSALQVTAIWPIRQKQPSEMRLPGFRWLDAKRPKTKYDLLEEILGIGYWVLVFAIQYLLLTLDSRLSTDDCRLLTAD